MDSALGFYRQAGSLPEWIPFSGVAIPRLSCVSQTAARVAGWPLAAVVTALRSVGINLGRFLQGNSWDVFQAPLALAHKALGRFNYRNADLRVPGFRLLFVLLLLFVYVAGNLIGEHMRCRP